MTCGIRELIFMILMVGLLGSSYMFVFKPATEKRISREAEIMSKHKALEDLRQSTAGISDLEQKIKELEQAIRFFESRLPQEKEIDKILKDVWQMAKANSLETRTIKTLKSEKAAGYSEQQIQMTLAGDFIGFHSFLREMEKMSRIVRVNQM